LHAEIELFAQLRGQLSKRLNTKLDNAAERHVLDKMEKQPIARALLEARSLRESEPRLRS
jgi:hypothetical protein